ncbi:MAG: UvrD-helicase domain-containing protein [Planctomycetota bacterium]|nr:UvrD-helicase domain-containing protein [Planctomycetota bacterium]
MKRSRSGRAGFSLRHLNNRQKDAVTSTEGPLLVLAGAGTGKTRVITYRIAYLLRRGVPPEAILGVTFTNKAAREMRERVAELLGERPGGLTLSTFHSLGVRILREEANDAGRRRNFTIYDRGDQVALLRSVLRDIRGGVSASDAQRIHARLSLAKNRGLAPEDLIDQAEDDGEYLVGQAYRRYQEELETLNGVDFDDLIRLPVQLLDASEELRERYQRRFRYILVDEYQDTNGAQYRFTRALVGPERNLCVVGDDDQSIYGFRGAEVDKILRFERDFPGARVVKLEDNYRSTREILSLANAVISGSAERHSKSLRSHVGPGAPVEWLVADGGDAEADAVVSHLTGLKSAESVPYDTFAVLMRSAAQSRPFEEKLRLRDIPYTLIGGQSYFDRKEVRDVVAYWNVVSNPRDDLSLLRIVNFPRRGIGSTSVRRLDELARARDVPLREALRVAAEGEEGFAPRVAETMGRLAALFEQVAQGLERGPLSAASRQLLEAVDYAGAVRELYPDPLTAQARWNAVEELLASLERWEKENPEAPFSDFLTALSTDRDADDRDASRARGVTLMTLHSSKGLEFPVVYLVGLEEDLLPHRRSVEDGDKAVEEERRLLYVGITRARRRLVLTSASSRTLWGKERRRKPCRFLEDIEDRKLFEKTTCRPRSEATQDEIRGYIDEFRRRAFDEP